MTMSFRSPQAPFKRSLASLLLALSVGLGAEVAQQYVQTGTMMAYAAGVPTTAGKSVDAIVFNASQQQLIIKSAEPIQASLSTLDLAGGVRRLIIDLENAQLGVTIPSDRVLLGQLRNQLPAIRQVSVTQYNGPKPVVRLLLDIENGLQFSTRLITSQGQQIQLQIAQNRQFNAVAAAVAEAPASPDPLLPGQGMTFEQRKVLQETEAIKKRLELIESVNNEKIAQLQAEIQHKDTLINNLQRQMAVLTRSTAAGVPTGSSTTETDPLIPGNLNVTPRPTELTNALDESAERIQQLQQKNDALIQQLTGLQNQNASLNQQSRGLQQQITQLRQQAQQAATASQQQSSTQDAQRTQQITQLQHDNQQLAKVVQQLESQLRQLQASQGNAGVNNGQPPLTAENQALQQQALQAKLDETNRKMVRLMQTIQIRDQEITHLKDVLGQTRVDAQNAANNASNQSAGIQGQLDQANQKLVALQAQTNSQDTLITELKKQLSSSQQSESDTVKDLRKTLTSLNQKYDGLVSENQSLKQKLTTASSSGSGGSALAAGQKAASGATNKAELASLQTQLAEANGKLKQKDQKIGQLEQDLKAAATSNQTTAVTEAVEGLTGQLKQKEDEIRSLKQQLALAQATKPLPVATGSNTAATASKTEQQLRQQLTSLQQLSQQSLNDLEQQLRQKDQKIAELQRQNKGNRLDSPSDNQPNGPVTLSSGTDTVELKKLRETNRSLESQISSLKTQLAQKPSNTNPSSDELFDLKGQLNELKTQLSSEKERSTELNQLLAESEKQLTALKAVDRKTAGSKKAAKQPVASASSDTSDTKVSGLFKDTGNNKDKAVAVTAFVQGQELERDGQRDKAILQYQKAFNTDSGNSKYLYAYVSALIDNREFTRANDTLKLFLQQNPDDKEAYNLLGKSYLLEGRTTEAKGAFTQAIPTNVLNNYASALKNQGNFADAEKVFKMALVISPSDSDLLFNLGNLYTVNNQLEEAKDSYEKAIVVKPDFADAHYNLGLIYSRLGNNKNAVQHLEEFLKLSPNAGNAEAIRSYMAKLRG